MSSPKTSVAGRVNEIPFKSIEVNLSPSFVAF